MENVVLIVVFTVLLLVVGGKLSLTVLF